MATFEGDVAERREEWQVVVLATGEVRSIQHTLPEDRPGASLDEDAARRLAHAALTEQAGLDAARGQVKEISARPSKLKARTDWTFVFADTTLAAAAAGRAARRHRASPATKWRACAGSSSSPRNGSASSARPTRARVILSIASNVMFGGLLAGAAVAGVIAWSRRQFAPRLFFAAVAVMLVVSIVKARTAGPRSSRRCRPHCRCRCRSPARVGLGLVGLTILAAIVGLALGARGASAGRAGSSQTATRCGSASRPVCSAPPSAPAPHGCGHRSGRTRRMSRRSAPFCPSSTWRPIRFPAFSRERQCS